MITNTAFRHSPIATQAMESDFKQKLARDKKEQADKARLAAETPRRWARNAIVTPGRAPTPRTAAGMPPPPARAGSEWRRKTTPRRKTPRRVGL